MTFSLAHGLELHRTFSSLSSVIVRVSVIGNNLKRLEQRLELVSKKLTGGKVHVL